ncbi:MAG: hypothetical protein H6732_12370 [Alphaproteobacteria bacterium]|nr:hypothetical protein [Alphaproteobacteria bacterium]
MSATEITLTFHKSLYQDAGIQAAVEAYAGHAEEIDVQAGDTETTVTLRGFHPGYADVLGDFFANHALFETIVRARETLGGVPL